MKNAFPLACLCLAWSLSSNLSLRAQEEAVGEAVAVVEPTAEPTAEATTEPTAEVADKPSPTPTLRPLTVIAGLTDDTRITGTLLDNNQIAVKTAFGEASIPLSEVAGIRFPSAEDTSTTIVMLNGDSITGATDVKFVNVETSWGNAKINGPSVTTMLFVPGLIWQSSDSLGGKRWVLTDQKTAAPQNTTNLLGQPGPGQPGTRVDQQGGPNRQPNQFVPNGAPQVIFGR